MTDIKEIKQQHASAIVLTHDGKILLQHRPDNWRTFSNMIATFGGHIEKNETPSQAIIRELNEELGATVHHNDLIHLGAITEEITQHTELVHLFFWHDKQNTITGCYECEAQYFDNVTEALKHPKLMDYARWALIKCQHLGLLEMQSN